jgi:hypothetical protein
MAAGDLLHKLVALLSDVASDIVTQLSDATSSSAMLARAGIVTPAGSSADGQATAAAMDALRAKSADADADSFALIQEFGTAMVDVVAFVQQVSHVDDLDDAWNLTATYVDLIAVDRLRDHHPEAVAVLRALHLLSDDRLLIADLIRAGPRWGKFVLGEPDTDDATVDNLSLIFGAALVVLAALVPLEDDSGKRWLVDLLFGWDPEPSPQLPRVTNVLQRMFTLRFQHLDSISGDALQENFGLSGAWVPPHDGGFGLYLALDVGGQLSFPVGEHLELVLAADSPDALEAFLGPSSFVRTGLGDTTGKVLLRRKQEVGDNWTIGADDKTHLEIGTFQTGFQLVDPPSFVFGIGGGALVIPQDAIGFLKSVLPSGGMKFDFDVELNIDTNGKLSFTGGAGMTVVLPVNASLSILKVRSITVALMIEAGGASLATTVAFGLTFGGAFIVSVDGIGAKLHWSLPSSPAPIGTGAPTAHGNLGPLGDLSLDFVPPKGVGIQIGVDPVKGGGFLFFDPPHRTYGGVLEASLSLCGKGLDIKAAGLLRETDDGYDFVLILSVELHPAPQILGLSINGIGGMVGINVAVDVDKLRSGVHDGAISRLLFPDDPVANAPAIIATMSAVFPHHKGGYVTGLLLQLGWGAPDSFVTLSLGIVVAFPKPTLVMLLGSLRLVVPTKAVGIIDLKVDFLGVCDFSEPTFSFDGSLIDSKVASFPLTGDMTARTGKQAFVVSFGGYHPNFHPPVPLPPLRRIALDISPSPLMKIKAEAYLAFTSNTFQTGLHAALDIDAGVASLHGWVDFDALVQWDPKFYFSVKIGVGLELRVGGSSWAGISVDLLLEGPGPYHAKGDASLHLFFFTIHAGFDTTWGEDDTVALPPQTDAAALVAQALAADGAWSATTVDGGTAVNVRAVADAGVRLHPDAQLCARQQAVPIGVPITRVGQSPVVGGATTVQVSASGLPSTPSIGQFAASQFVDLSDDEKLSRPSFEPYQDGVVFGPTAIVTSADQLTTASYETVFIPDQPQRVRAPLSLLLLEHGLTVGAIARSGLHFAALNDGPRQTVTLSDPGYRVVSAGTLTAAAGASEVFGSAAAAFAAAGALGGDLLVVGAHEVVG